MYTLPGKDKNSVCSKRFSPLPSRPALSSVPGGSAEGLSADTWAAGEGGRAGGGAAKRRGCEVEVAERRVAEGG